MFTLQDLAFGMDDANVDFIVQQFSIKVLPKVIVSYMITTSVAQLH